MHIHFALKLSNINTIYILNPVKYLLMITMQLGRVQYKFKNKVNPFMHTGFIFYGADIYCIIKQNKFEHSFMKV